LRWRLTGSAPTAKPPRKPPGRGNNENLQQALSRPFLGHGAGSGENPASLVWRTASTVVFFFSVGAVDSDSGTAWAVKNLATAVS
jgi:hypothetical protein